MAAAVGAFVKATITGGTGVTTSSITTTTGDALVALASGEPSTFSTPTENKGNTFSAPSGFTPQTTGGGAPRAMAWKVDNATGGSGHTASFSFSTSADYVVFFGNLTGAATAAYDTGVQTVDNAQNWDATTPTLAQANNVAIGFVGGDGGGNPNTYAASGWTVSASEFDGSLYWTACVFSKITSATTALPISATATNGAGAVVQILVFKEGSAPPGWNTTGTGPRSVPMLSAGPIGGGAVGFFDGATVTTSGSPYTLVVDPASYTLTAAAETLTATRALSVDPQSYAVSAAAVNLAVGRVLNVSPASYALTASAQTLTATRALNISPASYAITAAPVTLSVGRVLSVAPASYSLTAAAETLSVGRALSFDPVSYALSAADVTLTYTPVSGSAVLVVDPASYTLTAANEALMVTRALSIDPASYAVSAAAVTLSVGRVLSVGPVSYSLTASPVALTATRVLSVDPVAYAITAAPVTLDYVSTAKVLVVDPVAYVLTTSPVTFETTSRPATPQDGGGGGGGKKRKGKKGPIYYRHIEPEDLERFEQAAKEIAAEPEQPKKLEKVRAVSLLKQYGIYQEQYARFLVALGIEIRQQQAQAQAAEEDEMMAVIAACL
jgi:hypothetical protein